MMLLSGARRLSQGSLLLNCKSMTFLLLAWVIVRDRAATLVVEQGTSGGWGLIHNLLKGLLKHVRLYVKCAPIWAHLEVDYLLLLPTEVEWCARSFLSANCLLLTQSEGSQRPLALIEQRSCFFLGEISWTSCSSKLDNLILVSAFANDFCKRREIDDVEDGRRCLTTVTLTLL